MACSGCDWDPEKDLENQRKHEGIRFEDACCVFDDPYREETEDEGDYDEARFIVLEQSRGGCPGPGLRRAQRR